jgi:hypothetical protein
MRGMHPLPKRGDAGMAQPGLLAEKDEFPAIDLMTTPCLRLKTSPKVQNRPGSGF